MWPIIRFPHLPSLYWLAVVGVCAAHLVLCRGYPPLRPDELIACFVAPFLAGLPALFDDRRVTRDRGITAMAIVMGVIYGIVFANHHSGRPSIGHLSGMHGVVIHLWFFVAISSLAPIAILWMCLYFYERVTGDLWAFVRCLRVTDGDRDNTGQRTPATPPSADT